VLEAARDWINGGDYHILNYDTPDIVHTHSEAFWQHFEIYTGEKPPTDRSETFIGCSC
jgi:hypothetical protein